MKLHIGYHESCFLTSVSDLWLNNNIFSDTDLDIDFSVAQA